MTRVPVVLGGLLLLAVGVLTFLLARSGRIRAAWTVPGVFALAIAGIFLLGEVSSGEGQAGLALYLIVVIVFAPLFAASLIGTLVGLLVRRLGFRTN